jgi:hypothetical protein
MTINVPMSPHGANAVIDRHPDQCPICHHKITPDVVYSKQGGVFYKSICCIVYHCPNKDCDELFIGYFALNPQGGAFLLTAARPKEFTAPTFNKPIQDVSPTFCSIYGEAHKAEMLELLQICGIGYRKSLEFLIKDYLIKLQPDGENDIKRAMLGPCIERYVTDQKIKDVAKRATWLGNDETHYERRWIDKDLTDLKAMIRLTIYWVEAEILTKEALGSMPDPTAAATQPTST